MTILADAARALEFLHRKSLIHRDIKSPNILLDSQHRCKIADFGMARQLGANMTVVGTGGWITKRNSLTWSEPKAGWGREWRRVYRGLRRISNEGPVQN